MAIPTDTKDQAIYHTILGDLHRLQGLMLNMQSLDTPHTAKALREHFSRDQTVVLGRLTEWKQRRPDVYREASEDFQNQVRTEQRADAQDR